MKSLVINWPKHFTPDFTNLVYDKVRLIPNHTFVRAVVKLLLLKKPPHIAEFLEAITEVQAEHKRSSHRPFPESSGPEIHPDDAKVIVHNIKQLIAGKLSEHEKNQMKEMLTQAYPDHNNCRTCKDSGIVFAEDQNGYKVAFRCSCVTGSKFSLGLSLWSNNEGYKRLT